MSLRESRVDREQELLQGLTDVHLLQLDDDWKLGKPRSPTREQTEAMAREKERRGLDKPPGFSSVGFLEDEDYLVGAEEFFKERYGVLGKILSFAMSMGKNPLIMILVPGLFLFWLTGWFLYNRVVPIQSVGAQSRTIYAILGAGSGYNFVYRVVPIQKYCPQTLST